MLVACLVLGIALSLRWYLDAETRVYAATRVVPAPGLVAQPFLRAPLSADNVNAASHALKTPASSGASRPCGREWARDLEVIAPETVSEEVYGTGPRTLFDPNG
jgi:hypothetical protein